MRANDERVLVDIAAKRPNMNDPVNISILRTRPLFMPLDYQYITQDHSIGVDGYPTKFFDLDYLEAC